MARSKVRLGWNGNLEAQRQADGAYKSLKFKPGSSKRLKRKHKKRKARQKRKNKRNQPPGKPDYYEYMNSWSWRRKREEAFQHYGRKCSICGSCYELRVHHRSYMNLGHEPMEDLQVLCQDCHNNLHEDAGYLDGHTAEYLSIVRSF